METPTTAPQSVRKKKVVAVLEILTMNAQPENTATQWMNVKLIVICLSYKGTAKAWSWNTTGLSVAKSDLKDLSITEDDAGVLPLPLRNVLDLDVDRFETRFQSGNVVKKGLK